jgi:hypothetical protein
MAGKAGPMKFWQEIVLALVLKVLVLLIIRQVWFAPAGDVIDESDAASRMLSKPVAGGTER